jgi:peroxiredoxin
MSLVERHQLEFRVLSDLGSAVSRRFGLVFTVPDDLEAVYHDIGAANGADVWEIPIPATYVIAPDLTITYAFVDSDYGNRAEPADVIAALTAG